MSHPHLASYIGRLDSATNMALARVLGMPAHVTDTVVRRDRIDATITLSDAQSLHLVLREREEGTWRVGRWTVTVDPAVRRWIRDPEVRSQLTALAQRFAQPLDDDSAATLDEAIRTRRMFLDERDEGWRQIVDSPQGRAGMLRLGFRCNQDCYFCPQDRHWVDPPWEMVEGWVDAFVDAGLKMLTITGGEPSAYRQLPDVIRRAKAAGMFVVIQTNAIRMASERYTKELVEAGLDAAFVSFHSHEPDVSDRMTRSPGTWERTVRGIEQLLAAGVMVATNCCVVRENVHDLAGHAQFLVDRFVAPFPDNPLVSTDYSQPGHYFDEQAVDGSMVSYAEAGPGLVAALRTLDHAGVAVNVAGSCGFTPCVFRDAPELTQWFRRDAMNHADLQARSYAEVCAQCAAKPYCPGVRRQTLERFGDAGLVPFETLPECAGESQSLPQAS